MAKKKAVKNRTKKPTVKAKAKISAKAKAPAKKAKAPAKAKAPVKAVKKVSLVSALQAGAAAPELQIPSDSGQVITLKQFRGKTVVLYFYPKDDTPGCTQESCDFRDNLRRLESEGAVVLGISKDSVESHQKFKGKFALPFPLLSDESGRVCEAYGVWKEKSMYGRTYMGIERSTFVIDGSGKLARIYPKVSVKGHVDQVIQDIRALKEL